MSPMRSDERFKPKKYRVTELPHAGPQDGVVELNDSVTIVLWCPLALQNDRVSELKDTKSEKKNYAHALQRRRRFFPFSPAVGGSKNASISRFLLTGDG